MKKLLFLFLLILIAVPLVSSSVILGDYSFSTLKQGQCLEIPAICENCSYMNITVTYPNGTIVVDNQAMTPSSPYYYNYTFCDTNTLGTYSSITNSDDNGYLTTDTSFFEVTLSGEWLTEAQAILYSVLWIFSLLLLIGLVVLGVSIPVNNKSDAMTGYIIAVSNLKYVKLTCLGLAWAVGIFLSYFTWMLSYAYLDFDFLTSIMQFVFYGMAICTLPMFIFFVYLTIANLVRDSNIAEQLQRGLDVNG